MARTNSRGGLKSLDARFTPHQLEERTWRIGRRKLNAELRWSDNQFRLAKLTDAFRLGVMRRNAVVARRQNVNVDLSLMRSVAGKVQGQLRLNARLVSMVNRLFGRGGQRGA